MFDLVMRNGTIRTALDIFVADVGLRDGRIVQIGEALGRGAEEMDASGHYVLPGGIDSHVHFAQPSGDGIVMADDSESGTRSALFGALRRQGDRDALLSKGKGPVYARGAQTLPRARHEQLLHRRV